jgi:hypothetical protein
VRPVFSRAALTGFFESGLRRPTNPFSFNPGRASPARTRSAVMLRSNSADALGEDAALELGEAPKRLTAIFRPQVTKREALPLSELTN